MLPIVKDVLNMSLIAVCLGTACVDSNNAALTHSR